MTLADELHAESLMADEDVDTLEDLVERPTWMLDALCREHPEINFFPSQGDDVRPAQAVCARCLTREACLDAALRYPVTECHGVWGGTTQKGRRLLLRQRGAAVPPPAPRVAPSGPITCRICERPFERSSRVGRPPSICRDCQELRAA